MAGMLGYFLVSGRRSRADSSRKVSNDLRGLVGRVLRRDAGGSTEAETAGHASSPDSQSVRNTATVETSNESSQSVTSEPDDDNPLSVANLKHQLQQITRTQWIIAAAVLIAVPLVAYTGTFFIYPFVEDLIEGESPIAAVLAEYGVDEGAETQLLTIRRGDLVNSVSVNGTLEYANRERLSFGTSGTIDTIDVEVGDFVSEGDVLMSLEAEAIVTAEQNLQNASVALQEAEDELNALTNPDEQSVSEATLNVLNAHQLLADAQDAYNSILEPTGTDIANAELEVAKANAAVADAIERLSDLQSPTPVDIENAILAVAEAEKALDDLKGELTDLAGPDGDTFSNAELAAAEATKARNEAQEAYENAKTIDKSALNQAELDVAEAKLALVEAETAITNAEIALRNAVQNAGDEITRKKLEIATADAALAAAVLTQADAQQAYADAQKPFDEDEVAGLRTEIAEAEEDIEVAQNQLRRLEIQTETETRTLTSELYEARNTYRDAFYMWLGMDISRYEWNSSPEEIFADIGQPLDELLASLPLYGSLDPRRGRDPTTFVVDDPDTPWDEVVTTNWSQFFGDELRFDCEDDDHGINQICVNQDFNNAWDDLLVKTEAYDTAMLANTQHFDNTEDAVDNARSQLEDLEEQLEEALTPTDDETLHDLFAKAEVASYTLLDAQNKLETLLEELERLEPELESRRKEAEQTLAVAYQTTTVAFNALTDAEKPLAELKAGTSKEDLIIAEATARKTENDRLQAIQNLELLRQLDSPELTVLNRKIDAAHADIELKIEELNTLVNGDDTQIILAKSELSAAQQDLTDTLTALEDLISPDQTDVDIARQEIAVANADLGTAQRDLDSLVNPDPATVALRRAEAATAREELVTAIAATQGTQIIAPFDGVVAEIQVEEGQSVNKDAAAVVIADPSIVEISGTVDEVDVLFLQVGDSASIELEALGDEALIGRISDIAAFGESNQGVVTYPVTIQTEQPAGTQLPEGLSAVAEVVIREQSNRLLVPIQALFGSVNDPILLIPTSDGTLVPRNVTLGISDDFWTVIEDGVVGEGETILMTVVGSDTSQFGGFRAVAGFGGGPRR